MRHQHLLKIHFENASETYVVSSPVCGLTARSVCPSVYHERVVVVQAETTDMAMVELAALPIPMVALGRACLLALRVVWHSRTGVLLVGHHLQFII